MNNETNDLLEAIVNAHGIQALKDWQQHWPANYNVAPTTDVPVAASHQGTRTIESARWGMVAPYAKEFGGKPTINARIETVATNGMFKKPFAEHRVVVPALGYYEWQEREDGKQPYFIRIPGEPLALAGILRTWHDKTKNPGEPEAERLSMAIITDTAQALLRGDRRRARVFRGVPLRQQGPEVQGCPERRPRTDRANLNLDHG